MRPILTILLSISALTGCGERAQQAASLESVTLVIDWQPGPTYLGVYYAREIGAFERAGFDVAIEWVLGAHLAISAVVEGRYPIGTASGGATVVDRSHGIPIKSLAVLYPNISTVIYGLAGTGIDQPSDIEGRRIGIYPGSINNQEFDAFVHANGLDESKIAIVPMSGDEVEALLAGEVDGVLQYRELAPARLELDARARQVDGKRTYQIPLAEFGVASYGLNIVATDSLVHAGPAMLGALTDAILQGYRQGCDHPFRAVDAFVEEFPDMDRDYVAAGWSDVCSLVVTTPGAQSEEGWRETIAMFDSLGLIVDPIVANSVMAQFLPVAADSSR